jgi:prepilin-type N-terminal cleavage/methylation domain-containing protein
MAAKKAFTLVEILIVVVILAILAAVVLPRFSNATAIARASMLADDLRIFRMQAQIYKSQHCECPPGFLTYNQSGSGDIDVLARQLTMVSKVDGNTAAVNTPGYTFGPYLREIPEDPVNGMRTVQVVTPGALPGADDSHGWLYQPSTMTIRPDCTGADDKGVNYSDY